MWEVKCREVIIGESCWPRTAMPPTQNSASVAGREVDANIVPRNAEWRLHGPISNAICFSAALGW
jgi:hypothetical protein